MNTELSNDLESMGFTIMDYHREKGFIVFVEYYTGELLGVCNDNQADFEEALRPDWFHWSGLITPVEGSVRL